MLVTCAWVPTILRVREIEERDYSMARPCWGTLSPSAFPSLSGDKQADPLAIRGKRRVGGLE